MLFNPYKTVARRAAVVFTAAALVAGCAKKQTDTSAATPPSAAKGQAAAVPTGEVKGTLEQEAAKQRAIEQGPAIEAALKAQQEGHPVSK